ncbi:MAG: ABC transporter ATP-binding protein [Clostridiaceae bacterium]|nr:ABC transporter ATP-binding protein [Clostridiaceae bacterium]
MSKEIIIEHAVKRYDNVTIIKDLSLRIGNSELFTLLGPSGCGKTTLLRMIAGFNTIEGGTIRFGDTVINNIPAHKRNIGMVFQDYAIFPHLTVAQNIMYGLKEHKVPREEAKQRLEKMLRLTKIEEYRDRLPERLSGGQQQRVALARAIAIHPDVLLMDEPLSNLDAKLRVEMREIIRDIQKQIGITTVYVTHDQEEALAISDRIAVMNFGDIQQVGTPHEIYTRPFNVFVADFIGRSGFFCGEMEGEGSRRRIKLSKDYTLEMDNILPSASNGRVIVGIRPEEFCIAEKGMTAKVRKATYLGKYITYVLDFEDCSMMEDQESIEFSQHLGNAASLHRVGDTIKLAAYAQRINVFSPETKESIIRGVARYGQETVSL